MKKPINTMEELSAEIGVSRPTLSKFFQDPNLVRRSTRERISSALLEVDYVPNFFARNMNRKQTSLIGVVVPHMNDLFYMTLLQEIETRARELDFSVIIQNSHGEASQEIRAIDNLRSMNAEGVIVAPIGASENTPTFKRLAERLSLVFVDARCPGLEHELSFVGTDNQQSIRLIVDYLCRSGTPPKFLAMPNVNTNSVERENAYRQRLMELGHTPEIIRDDHVSVEKRNSWDFEAYAYELMRAHFADGEYADATILCASDRLAMGVLRAANEAGLFAKDGAPANGLRVAGHDDHPLSAYVWPSLTTVSQDASHIGKMAVDCVLNIARANGDEKPGPVEHLFQAQLKLRDSA